MRDPQSSQDTFFFLVHNRNHVRLFAPVAQALREAGKSVQFVHLQEIQKLPGAPGGLQEMGLAAIPVSQLFEALSSGATVIVGNDWSPRPLKDILLRARVVGTRLVGIVDGCRFGMPPRYRLVDEVLAWGPSSKRQMNREVNVVGSPAIERAAADRSWFEEPPIAAINYKFAYAFEGTQHKDNWVSDVLAACRKAGIAAAVSQHPGNPEALPGLWFSDIDDLLRRASVLISRSSTVVYEALARGKPVVLYPYPDEKLCEFAAPMGAFEIAGSTPELPAMIQRALRRIPEQANFGARFLARHVEIGPNGQATQRIVARLLGA
jgi:hypothetical protein